MYFGIFLGWAMTGAAPFGDPPPTERRPVAEEFHGTSVTDDYRWLEDWESEEVRAWTEAQNKYARNVLDQLPHLDDISRRVTEIMSAETISFRELKVRDGRLFVMKRQPPRQQPFLVMLPSEDAVQEKVLVDPNSISSDGSTSIDWYVPSPSGELVAVSLSQGGSEAGDLHVFQTSDGKEVFERIPRVNTGTAGGDLAWTPDGSGFYYTRHPRGTERPPEDLNFYQQVYFHKLGTPTESDRYEIGEDFPRIAEIEFEMDHASGRLLATVQNGDGGEFAHFVRTQSSKWLRISSFGDKTVQVTFGPGDDLFLISRVDAPRGRIDHAKLVGDKVVERKTIIHEDADTIVTSFYGVPPSLLATQTRLYTIYQLGGPSEIRVFDHDGTRLESPEQLPISAVGGFERFADEDDVVYSNGSFSEPSSYYVYEAANKRTRKTRLANTSPVSLNDVKVVREFATSKDGTKVPVNILLPPGIRRDSPNPTLVTGYGGYGISLSPRFSATTKVLLEQGMIVAIANLRGGGEYGEQWHRQGNLTNKQNVFDDFAAVLKHLISRGYTRPDKLAIEGGSNGGLLMGALLTQDPHLVKCVVSHVGIYDMLRVELSPNGTFNIPEFGTVKNPDHFQAMHAYSPLHRVQDGIRYPPTLFLTGANDPRVDPMQSRKMTARLQAATGPFGLILLRTSYDSGHGQGTALKERIAQEVDVTAFLFDQLEVDYQEVELSEDRSTGSVSE